MLYFAFHVFPFLIIFPQVA